MELIIMILYGVGLLIIGVYSAMQIRQPADYFVAGKRTGVLQVSGSLLATILGGSAILGTINLAQYQSWASAMYILSAALGLAGLLPLVKRVSRKGKFTLPELIGQYFGEAARKTASVIIPLAWLGIVAAQIIAASRILVSVFDVSYTAGVMISGTVFIVYTFVGGQLSILKTDFLQSLVILSGITLTAVLLPHPSEASLPAVVADFPFNDAFSPFDFFILVLTFSSTFVVGPDIYSRVFCARNESVARTSVWIVLLILIPFAFLLAYIGVYAFTVDPGQESTAALIHVIQAYLPSWMVGLMVAALLSAVLSSADTTLLTASMILSELFLKEIDNRKAFQQTRLFVVLVGFVSMLIALKITSIISALLLALSFYSGAFIIPMAVALFRVPINRQNGIAAMLVGGIVALAGKISADFWQFEQANCVIITGFVLNATILMMPARTSKRAS